MVTNRITLLIFFILTSLVSLNFQCRKGVAFDCDETKYNFEIGIKAYPDEETITIGDSIWLEVNDPDNLLDLNSNNMIDYSGVENLGTVISFQELEGDSFTGKAVSKFERILIKGEEVTNNIDPELFKEYLFEDNNGYYQFKMAVVAKDTGVFRIAVSNAANVYRYSDKCTKAYFIINFKETNQHYYLYPSFQGSIDDVSGTYYFSVN